VRAARRTERGMLFVMSRATVYLARYRGKPIATLALSTRKPWAIDRAYFSAVKRPLYLTGMAVHPRVQGRGAGRACLEQAARFAREWPADSICLDAFDQAWGAGGFYAKCGYREVGRATYRAAPLIYYEMLL
jgi:GNAT superfamily N-acetyltransferase